MTVRLVSQQGTETADTAFTREVLGTSRANLERCYQCQACSSGCPVAHAFDYAPHQLLRMVQLGLKDRVLDSTTYWLCASCETCATRCPNAIDIVRLMDVLRIAALRENFKISVRKVPSFHRIFVEQIRKRGRIDEAELLLRYKLRTVDLLSLNKVAEEALLGFRMLRKGKLRLPPSKAHQQKGVTEIFEKVLPRE